jgi:pimeloyl-ACP methyl ester carboxylesterase
MIGAGIVGIGLVTGLIFEQVQRERDRERFPQIGRSVDIGGRMLDIYCSGSGTPAVILASGATWAFNNDPKTMFENGAPRPGYGWVAIQRELAKVTTACWYDRAGSGWSDLGPYPRDSAAQARDLHALLQAAAVPPPYVVVAESSAALDARVYTGLFPADVAGMVLVDGVHPDLFRSVSGGRRMHFPALVGHSQDVMARAFNRLGLYRLGGSRREPEPAPPGITPAEWDTIWHLAHGSKAKSALMQDIASWEVSANEARASGSLGERPLVVVSSGNTEWMELQIDLVRLSKRGKQAVVGESRDDLMYHAPAAVIEAARQVLGR